MAAITPIANTPAEAQTPPNAGTVRIWNANAFAVSGTAGQPPNIAVLNMAMVQGAVYDAVNSIDRGHEPCSMASRPHRRRRRWMQRWPPRPIECWTDSAGGRCRPFRIPFGPLSCAQYEQSLLLIPDGQAEDQGVAAGEAAALAMLTAHDGDGRYVPFPLTVGTEPGEWRPAPPSNAIDPNSWISEVTPFTLLSTSQFRTPGPRNLNSAAYAHEYDEVKTLGAGPLRPAPSPRNAEQEAIARFFNVSPLELFNRTFRTISEAEGLSLVEEARLFGMLNISAADTIINCWNDKRFHSFWRPITAIHEGDDDGNKRTIGDEQWTPLEATPAYSDHTSGYNCMAGSLMNAGKAFFGGDQMDFSVVRKAPPPPCQT